MVGIHLAPQATGRWQVHERAGPLALVADDDAATRQVLVQALAHLGFTARAFSDGAALADAVASREPDLVVTDQHMRGGSGTDAVRRFRAVGAACPTILLTSFPGQELKDEVAKLGRTALLAKPVDLETLRLTIEQLSGEEPSPRRRA